MNFFKPTRLVQTARSLIAGCVTTLVATVSYAGPFAPAAGSAGTTAISADDSSIVAWASAVENYTAGTNVDIMWQTPHLALNAAGDSDGTGVDDDFTFDIVSLGGGGSITLSFEQPITNGEGYDFAVFENSFSNTFLELAWVEVSSDGVNFTRFPGYSLTPSPVSAFGTVDPTNISGFAGKYRGGFGTPFDLEIVKDAANLDVNLITHIRLIDIVGDGSQTDNLQPPNGPNPIYDPFPTSGSAGFDLDAVGVINTAQLPSPEHNVPIPPFFTGLLLLLIVLVTRTLRA